MSLNNNTASLESILAAVNALPDKPDTSGTATAADIFEGKTATVNDEKLTGTNPYNAANVDPAVTSALAAIAEKGVDTTGAGLSDIAGLIAAIEAGGGGMSSGTYIAANDTDSSSVTLTLNFGFTPKLFIMLSLSTGDMTGTESQAYYAYLSNEDTNYWRTYAFSSTNSSGITAQRRAYGKNNIATDTTIKFYGVSGSQFIAGVEYVWVAFQELLW